MSTIASREIIDPLPAGKLGMYFFLASEAMFFVGLLGSFVVLESAGGQHELFVQSSHLLSRWIGLGCAACLVVSSAAILGRKRYPNWIVTIASAIFLLLQASQWHLLPATQNNFFGWYYLTSAVHGLHVVAGILAVLWFTATRRSFPPGLQIYWHFVNAAGVISLAVLYFV